MLEKNKKSKAVQTGLVIFYCSREHVLQAKYDQVHVEHFAFCGFGVNFDFP